MANPNEPSSELTELEHLVDDVSHDINNLLLVISCSAEQLLTQLPTNDPSHNGLIAIRDAGLQITELTRKLQEHRRGQTPSIIDLNPWLTRLEQSIIEALPAATTMLRLAAPTKIGVNADHAERIRAAIRKALETSFKVSGSIAIESQFVDATDERSSDKWVCVSITTVGFLFVQDAIALETEVLQSGARFLPDESRSKIAIWFPVPLSDLPGDHQQSPPSETILVVDDDPRICQFLKRALNVHGYCVIEARHGPAAIAAALRQPHRIQLLITDIHLPEMNGYEVANALRTEYPTLPVLFLSGMSSTETKQSILNHGDFLQKPFKTPELLMKVREILDKCCKTE